MINKITIVALLGIASFACASDSSSKMDYLLSLSTRELVKDWTRVRVVTPRTISDPTGVSQVVLCPGTASSLEVGILQESDIQEIYRKAFSAAKPWLQSLDCPIDQLVEYDSKYIDKIKVFWTINPNSTPWKYVILYMRKINGSWEMLKSEGLPSKRRKKSL